MRIGMTVRRERGIVVVVGMIGGGRGGRSFPTVERVVRRRCGELVAAEGSVYRGERSEYARAEVYRSTI